MNGGCNAAGVLPFGKVLHELSTDEWDRSIDVNLRGAFLSMKYEAEAMLQTGVAR